MECNNCDKQYYTVISFGNASDRLDVPFSTGWQAGGSQTGFSFKLYKKHEYIIQPYVLNASVQVFDSNDTLVFSGIVSKITRFLYPNEEGIEIFVDGLSYLLKRNIVGNSTVPGDISTHIQYILSNSTSGIHHTPANLGYNISITYDYQTCQGALDELIKHLPDELSIIILPTGELIIKDSTISSMHILAIGSDIKDLDLSIDYSKLVNRLTVKWVEIGSQSTQQVLVNPNNLPTFDSQGGTVYPCPISVGEQWYLTDTNETITSLANVQTCPLINGASYFSFTPPTLTTVYTELQIPHVSVYNDTASQSIYGIIDGIIDVGVSSQASVDQQAQSYFDRYSTPRVSGKVVIYCANQITPFDRVAIVNYDSIHNIYVPYYVCTGVDIEGAFQTVYLNNPDEFVDEFRALI